MGTNACVSDGMKTSAFSNCVAEVNEEYGLSDASCEYVTSNCQAIYFLKEKRLAKWLRCSKFNQPKSHFFLSSFSAVEARKSCLSTALAECDDSYLNAIVATSSTFMTNQHLQCATASASGLTSVSVMAAVAMGLLMALMY